MPKWFYVSGGQQLGPVEESEIREMMARRQIGPEDLIWGEGMPQWLPARDVARSWGAAKPTVAAPSRPAPSQPMASRPAGAIPVAQPLGAEPMQLAYASPVVPEAPQVEHDEGPFQKIGKTFAVPGGNKWVGITIASPKAVYLMKVSQQMSGAAYGVGGIAGALLHKAFTNPDDVRTCAVGDLPEPVRQALDRKNKRAAKDAIVLPREAIHFAKVGAITNVLALSIGSEKFLLDSGLFAGGKIRRFLQANGWTLNQEVPATAAPIHGRSLGRTFEEAEKKKPNVVAKVVLGVLGALIIILYIFARVMNMF
ncbi:MAG TPA: DUF4339 domain-containing protein [Humisphaera sp.]|jgi:hypothetical protein|nr:DUF4339 domain-containing protein [Humisphaera sp.]